MIDEPTGACTCQKKTMCCTVRDDRSSCSFIFSLPPLLLLLLYMSSLSSFNCQDLLALLGHKYGMAHVWSYCSLLVLYPSDSWRLDQGTSQLVHFDRSRACVKNQLAACAAISCVHFIQLQEHQLTHNTLHNFPSQLLFFYMLHFRSSFYYPSSQLFQLST